MRELEQLHFHLNWHLLWHSEERPYYPYHLHEHQPHLRQSGYCLPSQESVLLSRFHWIQMRENMLPLKQVLSKYHQGIL
uniref:Uncharacterized protein n=1 Tax=Arundo donax TaxID=35708 RepID=A0A0A9CLW9_ARUDO